MISLPITTSRLEIRQLEPRDQQGFVRFMVDEDSTRFLNFTPEQKTAAGAQALFDFVLLSYGTREVIHAYAIADKATGTYWGSCGFSPYDDGVVECYYCVNPEQQGQGIASEATAALVQQLSKRVEVRAYCHAENVAAHAVAKRAGLQHIGTGEHKHSGLQGDVFAIPRSA